ncbi:MAG: RagB/SusD family nutrient uptake outer membrane protein [Bacteroidales bacterium]|nr:RagB/SusD family nutrient uptake outer membrane protein [Bacteroidales bacterium]
MKKIFAIGVAILTFAACNMDFYPSDSMTSSQLKDNTESAVYTTDGVYALFKDNLPYKGETSGDGGNMYVRHLFQLAETRGDNVTISGHSTDPFTGPYRYEDVDNTKNKYYFWWMAYKIIYAANSNIDGLEGVNDAKSLHLLGENYFFRAIAHFHMVQLFAMPYVCGANNPGIVLRIGMNYQETKRSTVGECYAAIVSDLKKAIDYMDQGTPRGDGSYVSAKAARALLSRVYLNMGDEHLDDCIKICNELIDGDPNHKPAALPAAPAAVKAVYSVATLSDYPKHTWDSPETIWCVRHTYPNDLVSEEATIGAMYFASGDLSETAEATAHVGWGQWFWSEELIELFKRYDDNRFKAYFYPVGTKTFAPGDPVTHMVCFPEKGPDGTDFCTSGYVLGVTPAADGSYSFTYEGKSLKATPVVENGYTRYYLNDNLTGDATFGKDGKSPAYVRDDLAVEVDPVSGEETVVGVRNKNYVRYFNTKFSGQDEQVTFSSPVILRWGEVFLNRAEAYARKNDPKALEDVNTIRTRAGLPDDAMFTAGNMHGYDNLLDVVLDERRMELCFEGDRMFSVFRNKKALDRRYVGYHPWEVINYDDPRIALLIPATETSSTPGFEQNNQKKN